MEYLQGVVCTSNEGIGCRWEVIIWVLSPPAKIVDIIWLRKFELAPVKGARLPPCTKYDRLSPSFKFRIIQWIACSNLFDCVEISILDRRLFLFLYLLQPFSLFVNLLNFATICLLPCILFIFFLNWWL